MKKVILPLALGVTLLGIGLTNQTTSFAQGKTSPKIVQTAKNSAPAFKLKNKKGKTESQAVSEKSLCNSSSAKQAGIKNNPDPGYWRYAVDLFV